MGGTASRQTLTAITNNAISASAKAIQNCTTTSEQSQTVYGDTQVGRSNLQDINQKITKVINSNCSQKAKTDVALQQAVVQAIKQEAETTGTDMALLTTVNSSLDKTIINSISADVNMDSIINSVNSQKMAQLIKAGKQIGHENVFRATQGITTDEFYDTLSDTIKNNKTVQEMSQTISQTGKTKMESTIGKIFDMIITLIEAIGAFFILIPIVAIIAFAYVMGPGSGDQMSQIYAQRHMQRMQEKGKMPMGQPPALGTSAPGMDPSASQNQYGTVPTAPEPIYDQPAPPSDQSASTSDQYAPVYDQPPSAYDNPPNPQYQTSPDTSKAPLPAPLTNNTTTPGYGVVPSRSAPGETTLNDEPHYGVIPGNLNTEGMDEDASSMKSAVANTEPTVSGQGKSNDKIIYSKLPSEPHSNVDSTDNPEQLIELPQF